MFHPLNIVIHPKGEYIILHLISIVNRKFTLGVNKDWKKRINAMFGTRTIGTCRLNFPTTPRNAKPLLFRVEAQVEAQAPGAHCPPNSMAGSCNLVKPFYIK